MRTAPSRQESVSAADRPSTPTSCSEPPPRSSTAPSRSVDRVDRRQVAGARLLVAREDADREARTALRALEEVLRVRGLADRARRYGVDLAGGEAEAAQKWAKTSIAAEARAMPSSPSSPVSSSPAPIAHRLVDLVGPLPPAAEPVRARRVDAEDDEPERVRAEVDDREPRELGARRRVRPGRRGSRRRVSVTLDELDAVTVGIAHEADARAVLAHRVGRLLGVDSLLGEPAERRVEVRRGDRDVVVARAQLVAVDAEVVGQLESRPVAGQAHEDVDRLVADRQAADLLEAERLVEGDGAVDVADSVAGVDQLGCHAPTLPTAGRAVASTPWS